MYEEYYEEVDLVCGMEMFAGLSILVLRTKLMRL